MFRCHDALSMLYCSIVRDALCSLEKKTLPPCYDISTRSGGAGGGRLFRWAAALSGGKTAEAPHDARQHQRSSSGSSSNGGGRCSCGSESGGDLAGGAGMAESTAAQAGLFASPLRNRFRPSRRGSKGWSSSSSQAGRGGGNGAGERGGGSAAAGLGSSLILGTLLKVGCCWEADCWMEQLLVPQRGRPQRDRCACGS